MTKKALVTGASEGIGQAIARLLKDEGYQITGVARSEDKLKEFAQELGAGHDYIAADLSTTAGQDKIIATLGAQHYDVLINNAGVGSRGDFGDVDMERQTAMLNLNMIALARLAHAFVRQARSGDALVNVSSVLGFIPLPGMALYSATKAFVTSFSDALWHEQKKRGVYVMGLHPGITITNFHVAAGGREQDVPRDMAQTPEEVAQVCIKALKARQKASIICGARNFIFAGIPRLLSRKTLVTTAANTMPVQKTPDAGAR